MYSLAGDDRSRSRPAVEVGWVSARTRGRQVDLADAQRVGRASRRSHQIVDAGAGLVVGARGRCRVVDVGMGDDRMVLRTWSKTTMRVVEPKQQIGQAAVVGRGVGEFLAFDVADGVVAGVADPAAGEGGQAGAGQGGEVPVGGELVHLGHGVVAGVFDGLLAERAADLGSVGEDLAERLCPGRSSGPAARRR